MKIELSAKTAKAFVKGVENMTDMILLSFSKGGVKTRTLNSDNTALLDLEIPKASTEVYDFGGAKKHGFTVFGFQESTTTIDHSLSVLSTRECREFRQL